MKWRRRGGGEQISVLAPMINYHMELSSVLHPGTLLPTVTYLGRDTFVWSQWIVGMSIPSPPTGLRHCQPLQTAASAHYRPAQTTWLRWAETTWHSAQSCSCWILPIRRQKKSYLSLWCVNIKADSWDPVVEGGTVRITNLSWTLHRVRILS